MAQFLYKISYSVSCPSAGEDPSGYTSLVCQRYAHIKEAGNKVDTVCGGEQRVRNIYMSDSHQLTVEIVPPSQSTENAAEFLLQYEGNLNVLRIFVQIFTTSSVTSLAIVLTQERVEGDLRANNARQKQLIICQRNSKAKK